MQAGCRQRSITLEAVRQFSPSWFESSMSTGIIALVIAGFPYKIAGQQEVAWAFWWINLPLFSSFAVVLLGRILIYPSTIKPLLQHPVQSMFLGTIPIALATIINGLPTFLLSRWSFDAVNTAAVVLWSIDAALAGLSMLTFPFLMFTVQQHSGDQITALWLLPILPGVVASELGGLIAQQCVPSSARVIILAAGWLWGISVPLAAMISTLYLGRLAMHKLPPKETIVSSFIPVSPFAMSALSLLNFTTAGTRTDGVLPLPLQVGAVEDVATVAALLLWGLATWWLAVAVASVLTSAKKMPFNMGWWAFVFPMGVLSLATVTLSEPRKLDSQALKTQAVQSSAAAGKGVAPWCGQARTHALYEDAPSRLCFAAAHLQAVGASFSVATVALWCMVVIYTVYHGVRGGRRFVAPSLCEDT